VSTDAEVGGLRTATGDELVQRLLTAPPEAMVALLDNPHIEQKHVLLALRRSDLPAEFVTAVSERPVWAAQYLIKSAIATHPRVPKTIAMNLIKFLFWRDLAKLVGAPQVDSAVRRLAEITLRDRLDELALGEKIALARMAPREVLKSIRFDRDDRVVAAMLDNPRATEDDALAIANRARSPPKQLALLARSAKWTVRYPVRLALIRNPRTPVQNALPLLAGLNERDLGELLENPALARSLRAAAVRMLKEYHDRRG